MTHVDFVCDRCSGQNGIQCAKHIWFTLLQELKRYNAQRRNSWRGIGTAPAFPSNAENDMSVLSPRDSDRPPRKQQAQGKGIVHSVMHAAQILHCLIGSDAHLTLTQMAAELGVHKTTVMRLLDTLEQAGMIRNNPTSGNYELAVEFWLALAARSPEMLAAPHAIQALLDDLSQMTGETVLVALPDAGHRTMRPLVWSVRERVVHIDPRFLGPTPLHAVASGKCYLAGLSDDDLRTWAAAGLPAVTPHTLTLADKLMKDIQQVRISGYAMAHEESIENCSSLAVPVFDGKSHVMGGLQLVTLTHRMTTQTIQEWLVPLQRAAIVLTRLLGLVPGDTSSP
jgi:DNA-binding IclR family transcriptional regulator